MYVVCVKENDKGKVEMTRSELEKILDNAYHKGYDDGYEKGKNNWNTITVPSWTLNTSNLTSTYGNTVTSNTDSQFSVELD